MPAAGLGQPNLTYQDLQQTLQSSGSNIRQVDSGVGTLVSVTVAETTDTGSTTFSLLIPRVTLWNGQPAHIGTVGVATLHRLTIDTPAHASWTLISCITCQEPRQSSNSERDSSHSHLGSPNLILGRPPSSVSPPAAGRQEGPWKLTESGRAILERFRP